MILFYCLYKEHFWSDDNETQYFFLVAMFSNDLCRPIIFQFDKESSVKGVWGNRYTIDDMFFANSTINKDNWCFEAPKSWANPKSTERLQFPSGVYNMGLCKFNSSTFISQPHFLGADPFYINQFVEGSLNPDEAKHQTSIVIGMFQLVLKYRNNRCASSSRFYSNQTTHILSFRTAIGNSSRGDGPFPSKYFG